ncbi:5'-methylthioadenosine/S-adenosylhomocysteine nucleosidase [Aminipila butyrica]|uniref:adenosylhomocysteine nucleosidase n=1 Tax=Aminipila butyrica TaxID=433296 RepID=A0A858BY47_9FIRM|nr:5'-methylthioadenosine/S-adenosylhomocysteine nucleosidase [Aminipila butyrica]QIB70372.1 5'-methylthioadenosine/S-adenosylhomocysteine nucleosidase [Aminipila butyrica]
MKLLGLICPCEEEWAPYERYFKEKSRHLRAGIEFLEGELADQPVVAVVSGVCKVNAAIAAQILVNVYQVEGIINSGTAGGMASQVKLLETVVSTDICYHDVNLLNLVKLHPFMDSDKPYFQVDGRMLQAARKVAASGTFLQKIHFGRMATGEQFIVDKERPAINDTFEPLCADMETGAIAHVCYVNQVPFMAVRSITDTEEHNGLANFEANFAEAASRSANFVVGLVAELQEG